MEFRLLGPVEVFHLAGPVHLGGEKPRVLLAALLLDAGRVVSIARLIDVLWDDSPPASARALVQTYVAGLRRALGESPSEISLLTQSPGYVLHVPPDALDLADFQRLVAHGRNAADPATAADSFRQALALWRGPALSGLASPALVNEAAHYDEVRWAVAEELAVADLALGRDERVAAELTALVSRHPMRERLRCQLMIALYRLGRQADALAVYSEGRAVLVEELGIEPGPELRQVHSAILTGDPNLLAQSPAESRGLPTGRPVPAVPAHLPPTIADFTGRSAQLATLDAALTSLRSSRFTAPPICVVTGKAGTGKSTLAIEAAHLALSAYPDGQLFVELHGMRETPATPEEVLGRFLRALGADPAGLPETLEERAQTYRTLLAGRRVLVVLDDAANERQIRPLLPGSSTCAVLITSRTQLDGLPGVVRVEPDIFGEEEACELLARIIGTERVHREPRAASRIVALCGRLPLAVRIAGARLATRPHWQLHTLADRLTDERQRLDELVVGDQEVRAGLALSYRALDETAQIALRRMGLLGLPDYPVWTVATLLDTEIDTAELVVERLVDARLVDFAHTDRLGLPRYRLHGLTRLFARELAETVERPSERDAAVERVLRSWLWLAERVSAASPSAGVWLYDAGQSALPVDQAVASLVLADPRGWIEAEQDCLVVGVERASAMLLDDSVAQLARALCGSFLRRVVKGLFDSWHRVHDASLAAARRSGNQHGEAALLAELGQLRFEQDRYSEARMSSGQAFNIFRDIGDIRGQAATLAALGVVNREQGYFAEALYFLTKAVSLARELQDDVALGHALRLSGSVRLEQGELADARSDLEASLTAYQQAGSRRGEALTLRTLGLLHRALDDFAQAAQLSGRALDIFAELGDELMVAFSVRAQVKAEIRLGCHEGAQARLEAALATSRALGDRFGQALTVRVLGDLHLSQGRLTEAEASFADSLRGWQELDLPLYRARTLRDLARLHQTRLDHAKSRALLAEALEIFSRYGAREHGELTDTAVL